VEDEAIPFIDLAVKASGSDRSRTRGAPTLEGLRVFVKDTWVKWVPGPRRLSLSQPLYALLLADILRCVLQDFKVTSETDKFSVARLSLSDSGVAIVLAFLDPGLIMYNIYIQFSLFV